MYLEDKRNDKAKLLDKIEEGYERVATAYSENYEYQATLQSIHIYTVVDLMIKESSSKIGKRRFDELHTLLIESMNLID